MTSDEVASLVPALTEFLSGFRPYFPREKVFSYLQKYVVGLLSDLKRKSIEPMALAAGVPPRTLQEFLSLFHWDEQRVEEALIRQVAEQTASDPGIGVFDGSGHVKQGTQTPGVQRQWCGEVGKTENCVIGHHLLYTDAHPMNPFSCVLASDLYLPKSWAEDRERCRAAGIPEDLEYRPGWQILVDQLTRVIAHRVRFSYVTFDEEFGSVTELWFALDRLGQRAIGEVKPNFYGWTTLPKYVSGRSEFAPHRVDDLVAFEVRTYKSLMRHWLICRLAMFFLARETRRLREKKSPDHTGTSRGRGQHPDGAAVEPLLADVALRGRASGVLAVA